MSADTDDKQRPVCQRCRASPATQDNRTQKLCNDCFAHYVRTRPIKRLEALRGNIKLAPSRPRPDQSQDASSPSTSSVPTYLLALSGGASSLVLLHALDAHIASMISKTGRASYALHALHIHPGPEPDLAPLRSAFPSLTISARLLSSGLASLPSALQSSPLDGSENHEAHLETLFARAASPTAKADLHSALLSAALDTFAQQTSCTAVLRGDTTTTLSARALAAVAKGHAASLSSFAAEASTDGGVRVVYPLRDVLRRDTSIYSTFALCADGTLLDTLLLTPDEEQGRPRALKATSIDALARVYMADTETKYPGIVHNVLRTVDKLSPLPTRQGRCGCCGDVLDDSSVVDMCGRCEREFEVTN